MPEVINDPLGKDVVRLRDTKIVLNKVLRNAGIERKVQEMNRENAFYMMLAIGGIILFIAMVK
jgi:hypothetical protein